MALVLPFVLLVLGAAYTGWDAMHRTIGLTSAARAGTISAANDLQNGKSCTTALTDATNAVNAEEGVTGVYTAVTVGSGLAPCTTTTTCTAVTTPAVAPAMTGSCVTLGTTTGTLSTGQGLTVFVTSWVNPDTKLAAYLGEAAARKREQPDRVVGVEWAPGAASVFLVVVQVEALDRSRLLADLTQVLSDQHVNILAASVTTTRDRVAVNRFTFEMGDPKHLGHVLKAVKAVDGVYDAYRVTSTARS